MSLLGVGFSVLAVFLLIGIVAGSLLMYWAAGLCKVESRTYGRALAAVLLSAFASAVATTILSLLPVIGTVAGLLVGILVSGLIIKAMFEVSFGKALFVWLVSGVLGFGSAGIVVFLLASVALPKFATSKDRALEASVRTDLRNLMTAEEAFFSDSARYGSTTELRDVAGWNTSTGTIAGIDSVRSDGYVASATHRRLEGWTCRVSVGSYSVEPQDDGVMNCGQ